MELQTFEIHGERDIILTRMEVRRLAREAGLALPDQARVALSASTLAQCLGIGSNVGCTGSISVNQIEREDRSGFQIVVAVERPAGATDETLTDETLLAAMDDVRWMVDEMLVETLDPAKHQVTVIKWLE